MVLKTYREVKPHSSEESEDKVVEVGIYNNDNDEYVYIFIVVRAPVRR